jgi:hypothetical protein
MLAVMEYDRTNIGQDISISSKGRASGRPRKAYVLSTKDEHAFPLIDRALTEASSKTPYYVLCGYSDFMTFLITDNTRADLFAPSLSPFVRMANAKHVIFHHIRHDFSECLYTKAPEQAMKEFASYIRLFVLDWATQILGDESLMPPFLIGLHATHIIDLLFGRKSIFCYFDRARFVDHVNRHGGPNLGIRTLGDRDSDPSEGQG